MDVVVLYHDVPPDANMEDRRGGPASPGHPPRRPDGGMIVGSTVGVKALLVCPLWVKIPAQKGRRVGWDAETSVLQVFERLL
jgi:hypothetical protein